MNCCKRDGHTAAQSERRHVRVDCCHGTTDVVYTNPIDHRALGKQNAAIRMALAKHYYEEHCRCARRAWPQNCGASMAGGVCGMTVWLRLRWHLAEAHT
jgi:hypothetical protein